MICNKILQKITYILILTLSLGLNSYACQSNNGEDKIESIENWHRTDSIILNKTFYLLAVIQQSDSLQKYIQNDKVFNQIIAQKINRAKTMLQDCKSVTCYASAITWKPYEIYLIGNELMTLAQRNVIFKNILVGDLKDQASYINYEKYGDAAMIRMAWYDCALGINQILDVYIKGERPLYPAIDSISFNKDDPRFEQIVSKSVDSIFQQYDNNKSLFFEIPLRLALEALKINGRDEAARYEPMKEGMNQLPFLEIKHTKWSSYRYSVILVPGEGPKRGGVSLNPVGAYRCRLAAERFKKGLAPFIVVSGGHVHPFRTPFSEAVEMRKYLIDSLHIPTHSIIIEPHARHTTTNIRNTCRIIYHFSIPLGKPVLIVTDSAQNSYILHLDARCRKELGYLPYQNLIRISKFESTFYPTKESLQANPFDPLDP